MRIPIQDRRTQRLRPIATPGQGQAPVSGASLAGQALQQASKLAMEGQKIHNAFLTARMQDRLNDLDAAVGERWNQLQQMRGYNAISDEKASYTAQMRALEELRESHLQELPSNIRRQYEIASDKRLNSARNRFQGYALEQARQARRAANQTAEKNALEKAATATSFDEAQEVVDDLFWIEDEETGERAMGSTLSELVLEGAPQALIDRHEKELRADAHMRSIGGQITAAREQRSLQLIESAEEHLEKAQAYLPQEVAEKLKKRIETERVTVEAEGTYGDLLTLAARASPDPDGRWVDEATLSNLVNQIEDTAVRSAVRKLVREYAPLREKAREGVVKRYGAAAIREYWDTGSVTAARNSEAMQWLGRNDDEAYNKVNEFLNKEARAARREGRANESLALRRQRQAAQDPANIRLLWQLREDMLMNPDKYAAEDYDIDSLVFEWGEIIPGGLHNDMYSSLHKHKTKMQSEEYRRAMDHFRRAVNQRRDKFSTADERRKFVGAMMEIYDQEVAPGERATVEDVERIIKRAEARVVTDNLGPFNRETSYAEALMDDYDILRYQDGDGNWVEGDPPPGAAFRVYDDDGNLVEEVPATSAPEPQDPGAPPPGVDPDEWNYVREGLDPEDRNDPEVIRRALEWRRERQGAQNGG